jgi:hypothetical protein
MPVGVIPCALQHEMLLRRHGFLPNTQEIPDTPPAFRDDANSVQPDSA